MRLAELGTHATCCLPRRARQRDQMSFVSTTDCSENSINIGASLFALISYWEDIQKQIEAMSMRSDCDRDFGSLIESDLVESRLQSQQEELMQTIIELECVTTGDKLTKLQFWQRCKTLGNTSLEQFSATDQIGLSIDV